MGLGDVLDQSHVESALRKIHELNFKKFDGGAHGVVNVMNPNGSVDTASAQTQEMWVGTAWGVVAGMIQEGLTSQAFEIGASLYNTLWNGNANLHFRTPEAFRSGVSSVRANYYMRANAVWAVKHALDLDSSPASASP